jgi:hypothetical protein
VLTVLGGNIVYITCHLFYEDLALLSETQQMVTHDTCDTIETNYLH